VQSTGARWVAARRLPYGAVYRVDSQRGRSLDTVDTGFRLVGISPTSLCCSLPRAVLLDCSSSSRMSFGGSQSAKGTAVVDPSISLVLDLV
jgi:hypothetical protein